MKEAHLYVRFDDDGPWLDCGPQESAMGGLMSAARQYCASLFDDLPHGTQYPATFMVGEGLDANGEPIPATLRRWEKVRLKQQSEQASA